MSVHRASARSLKSSGHFFASDAPQLSLAPRLPIKLSKYLARKKDITQSFDRIANIPSKHARRHVDQTLKLAQRRILCGLF